MDPQLPRRLAERLGEPLPGVMVGSRFESRPRFEWQYDRPAVGARPAAVLALLYPHEGDWHLPLTLRPSHLTDHPGQVSLPGGALEPGEFPEAAARREFEEELGVPAADFEMLGRLSPLYVGRSNFLVTSCVAWTPVRPAMVPNPAEVERLLEVPLSHLQNPAHFGCHPRENAGRPYTAPHFTLGPYRVWGATCMILGELLTVLEAAGE